MRKALPFLYTCLLLASFYLYLLYSLLGRLVLSHRLMEPLPYLLLAVVAGSGLLWGVYHLLVVRVPWRLYPGLRFLLATLLLWGSGILLVLGLGQVMQEAIFTAGMYGEENAVVFRITGAIVSLILSLLFTLCDFSWFAYYRYAAETLALQRSQRRQRELQFDVLQAQLTPHYLFNSLNTASNLILHNSYGAEEYLRQLAYNIRCLLAQPQGVVSTLERELEVVDSFFHLMQVRYGERIFLQKQISEKCRQQLLPGLALQLLVENAIKHNVASTEKPVHIHIIATSSGVVVQNNITQPPQKIQSGKVGLQNLQERYQLLAGKSIEIEQHSDCFRVQLPYLRKERKEAHV